MTVRHQHYVSEFYLESFADPQFGYEKPRVWRFERGDTEPKLLTPANLAVQTHYYSVRTPEGTKNDVMEQFLARIESDTAPLLRRVANGENLASQSEHEKVSLFMATMLLRVPRARNRIESVYGDIVQLSARNMASAPGFLENALAELEEKSGEKSKIGADQLREFIQSDRYTMKASPVVSLRNLFFVSPQLMPILFFMNWTILDSESDLDVFVTSDNPVVYVDPTYREGWRGVGLVNPGTELSFALSPEVCLLGTHDPGLMAKMEASPPEEARRIILGQEPKMSHRKVAPVTVREINRRTVSHATRYIFSSANFATLRRFIEKHLPSASPAKA